MIMKQMVMPRTTSSESSRRKVAGAAGDWVEGSEVAEVVITIAVSVKSVCPLRYALRPWFAKHQSRFHGKARRPGRGKRRNSFRLLLSGNRVLRGSSAGMPHEKGSEIF
jgi:hypothetical protein